MLPLNFYNTPNQLMVIMLGYSQSGISDAY